MIAATAPARDTFTALGTGDDGAPDGIHKGVSFNAYCGLRRVNQSLLCKFQRSAAHAREYLTGDSGQSTDAMLKGTYTHAAILEPGWLEKHCVVAPKMDKRTKVGKAAWNEFLTENKDKEIITHNEWEVTQHLVEGIQNHKLASEILAAPGASELTACWTDVETQLKCKARIDHFCRLWGHAVIGDIKTSRDAFTPRFRKSIADFQYHVQAAWYLDGLDNLAPADRHFFNIVVEKQAPWCVQVFEIEPRDIEQGRRQYREYLNRYNQCLESGAWPGYSTGVEPIGLPNWARDQLNRGEENRG